MKSDFKQWGNWARSCPSRSLGYPNQAPFDKFRGSSIRSTQTMSDDRALEIDQALAKVFHDDAETMVAVIGHFQYLMNYVELSNFTKESDEIKHMSKDRVGLLINNAISWIAGYFVGSAAA